MIPVNTKKGIKEANYLIGYETGYQDAIDDLGDQVLESMNIEREILGVYDQDLDVLIHRVIHRVKKNLLEVVNYDKNNT